MNTLIIYQLHQLSSNIFVYSSEMNSKQKTVSIFKSILSDRKDHEELEVKYRPRLKGYESQRIIPSIDGHQYFDFLHVFQQNTEFKTEQLKVVRYESVSTKLSSQGKINSIL